MLKSFVYSSIDDKTFATAFLLYSPYLCLEILFWDGENETCSSCEPTSNTTQRANNGISGDTYEDRWRWPANKKTEIVIIRMRTTAFCLATHSVKLRTNYSLPTLCVAMKRPGLEHCSNWSSANRGSCSRCCCGYCCYGHCHGTLP